MAIERTYIDDTDINTALAKLAEYLQNKAVPEYFSKVESDDGVISCYTENDFLMMKAENFIKEEFYEKFYFVGRQKKSVCKENCQSVS